MSDERFTIIDGNGQRFRLAGVYETEHQQRQIATLESQNQALQEALEQTSQIQPRVLAMLRREGFKFETPLDLSEGWEKLAFTLYSTICEVDSIARNALSPTQETDPE